MANTKWLPAGPHVENEPIPVRTWWPGRWHWLHRDVALSERFGQKFYNIQPRHGLYACSRWDNEEAHSGSYPALGSPNVVLQLKPTVGRNIGIVLSMKVDAASSGLIKFYLKKGANRDILTLNRTDDVLVTSFGTSSTTYVQKQFPSWNMRDILTYPNVGNVEGEDVELEIYLENTVSTVRIKNLRLYSGMSLYAGTNRDYLP